MTLRHMAERMSRGVVLRRRLPSEFYGLPLYVSPEAGLRLWRKDLRAVDAMLFLMLKELVKPGAVVWDIGANVGLFTYGAAALAGAGGFVVGIEPDVWLAHLLARSAVAVQREGLQAAPVSILCAAVSNHNGVSRLQIAERARAANYLANSQGSGEAGGSRHQQQTLTVTLDFLLEYFPPPSVLKIDVETAEVEVIKGASKLLSTARPAIWCEVAQSNAEIAAELLREHGYELYSAKTTPIERIPVTKAPWDTLALPLPTEMQPPYV